MIETLEDLPLDTQLELVDLVHTDGAAPENFMLIGISHLSLPRLQRSSNLRAEFLHALSILPVTLPRWQHGRMTLRCSATFTCLTSARRNPGSKVTLPRMRVLSSGPRAGPVTCPS
ncbi:hypothetical protein ACFQFQ_24380 [Sulfitobacter porphyrae]|uniref:Uncharacterized protein n=1 Tax=Sulfitobacter porphyrae TaxID=1246864 RepID=A0ABW2BAY4_9RHOB